MRGVALCGLVPMNILDFAFAEDHYFAPGSLEGAELGLWHFINILGSGKFLSLFSILFGAGIILSTEKRDAAGEPVKARYLKRLGWLWIFGMLHAYLIWYGDILVAYAVTGFALFWCRKWSPKKQTIAGLLMLCVLPALVFVLWLCLVIADVDTSSWTEEFNSEEASTQKELITALRGSWLQQMPLRALYAFFIQLLGIPFIIFWIAGGLMFLGMALTKSGYLTGSRPRALYLRRAVAAIAVGGALSGASGLYSHLSGYRIEKELAVLPIGFAGMVILALGYASLILWWCYEASTGPLKSGLRAAGKMAFTNYIGQSIILSLIFYGHGLGLYARLNFFQVMTIVPAVWIFQIVASTLWMKHFRFGPLEWVWRCLTYGKRFPIRAAPGSALPE